MSTHEDQHRAPVTFLHVHSFKAAMNNGSYQVIPEGAFDPNMYSRFKFGDGEGAEKFGHALAEQYLKKHPDIQEDNGQIIVTSCWYKWIPHASSEMARHVAIKLREVLGEKVDLDPIHNLSNNIAGSLYATMERSERVSTLENRTYRVSTKVRGNRIVYVDDVTVSGASAEKAIALLQAANARAIDMLYVARLDTTGTEDPRVENALNNHAFGLQSINFVREIVMSEKFFWTTRLCRHVLHENFQSDLQEFLIELRTMRPIIFAELYYYCRGEGLQDIASYQKGFAILERVFREQ